MGRALWQEDGSVVYNCSWPLPVQTFSGSTPMGLVTIIYCLRFETSLFVASYVSQGYGGGIRPRLHTGVSLSRPVILAIEPRADPTENTASNSSSAVIDACLALAWISFSRNVLTEPLLRNGRVFICLLHSNCCIRCLLRGRFLTTDLYVTVCMHVRTCVSMNVCV
jgi:hypothetical protein